PKIAAARKTEPARLSKLVRGEIDWIVMKCLEKDRGRRYETASSLARDVERYLCDEAVEACPPGAGYRLRKLARRHYKALTTAALFVAFLVLGAAVCAWMALLASAAEREAAAQRDAAREAQFTADEQRRDALEKETAARAEADKAQKVLRLLQEMVFLASPDAAKGFDYTLHQMLDDFEAGLARRSLQPEIEAELRNTLGRAYYRIDQGKAEKQHQRVLQLA